MERPKRLIGGSQAAVPSIWMGWSGKPGACPSGVAVCHWDGCFWPWPGWGAERLATPLCAFLGCSFSRPCGSCLIAASEVNIKGKELQKTDLHTWVISQVFREIKPPKPPSSASLCPNSVPPMFMWLVYRLTKATKAELLFPK